MGRTRLPKAFPLGPEKDLASYDSETQTLHIYIHFLVVEYHFLAKLSIFSGSRMVNFVNISFRFTTIKKKKTLHICKNLLNHTQFNFVLDASFEICLHKRNYVNSNLHNSVDKPYDSIVYRISEFRTKVVSLLGRSCKRFESKMKNYYTIISLFNELFIE